MSFLRLPKLRMCSQAKDCFDLAGGTHYLIEVELPGIGILVDEIGQVGLGFGSHAIATADEIGDGSASSSTPA